ncbi:MAG: hypothetical protein MI974_06895 [Chitinophagales bacterium]|nr:hypothetical protein [Chitinophagales bacterium]
MPAQPLLYELLRELTKKELRQLKKYLRSPFVTHREDIGRMFNVLADRLYKDASLPDGESLFEMTYPNEPFNNLKLHNCTSELHAFIEQFVILQQAHRNPIQHLLALIAFYRRRGLHKHFNRAMRKIRLLQDKAELRNTDYYQDRLNIEIEAAEFKATHLRTHELNLQEIGNTMDVLYLSQKLRHSCTQLSHRAVYQKSYQFGLLDNWIDTIEESPYLDVPAIALYYYCYRFLTDSYSQVYFRKFREELSSHQPLFPKDELKDLYRAAINFCIRKLNEGSMEYTREGWELFQEGLYAEVFLENGQLSRFTFDNIVGFGLRLNEFSAVSSFINEYKEKLDPQYQSDTVGFNLARLEFEQKNYHTALDHLHLLKPKDLVNQLIAKTLLLKIYFESNEFDLLESHLDSFRSFIRRREVSNYHRENYNNIIYFTRKIVALAPYDEEGRKKLLLAVQNTPVVTEKRWLVEKLNERG